MPTLSKRVKSIKKKLAARISEIRARNPHRSFQRTRRRDYVRPLATPGYFAFTNEVFRTLWRSKKAFAVFIITYILLYALLVGAASQETYLTITDSVAQAGEESFGNEWGALGTASLTFLAVATSGVQKSLTESQQIFAAILGVMAWLTTVWYLRSRLAGKKVTARDAMYSAGAPIIPSILVSLVLLLQLLPVGIAAVAYAAAVNSGLLAGGVEAMLFWAAAGLLGVLSLYWITSTLLALVVVTLPGMYPFQAIKAAGALTMGRRIRILLRWLWMVPVIAGAWIVVLLPIILFDGWLKSVWPAIEWLPLVPVISLIMATLTVFWISAYIYLFYRKVVEYDDSL